MGLQRPRDTGAASQLTKAGVSGLGEGVRTPALDPAGRHSRPNLRRLHSESTRRPRDFTRFRETPTRGLRSTSAKRIRPAASTPFGIPHPGERKGTRLSKAPTQFPTPSGTIRPEVRLAQVFRTITRAPIRETSKMADATLRPSGRQCSKLPSLGLIRQ